MSKSNPQVTQALEAGTITWNDSKRIYEAEKCQDLNEQFQRILLAYEANEPEGLDKSDPDYSAKRMAAAYRREHRLDFMTDKTEYTHESPLQEAWRDIERETMHALNGGR